MAEGARLLSVYRGNPIPGSNPGRSAMYLVFFLATMLSTFIIPDQSRTAAVDVADATALPDTKTDTISYGS